MIRTLLIAALLCGSAAGSAFAGRLTVTVKDEDGKPAAEAVVELVPDEGVVLPSSRVPLETTIDQRHETFIPLVNLIRKGGHVIFMNNDTTMHQVYSFSPIRQFQFEIRQGERSQPVVFNTPGIAAIGCNIHDQMITYVYVAVSPFAAITDADGHASFAELSNGSYEVKIWHPRLPVGQKIRSRHVAVGDVAGSDTFVLPLVPPPVERHMHTGVY